MSYSVDVARHYLHNHVIIMICCDVIYGQKGTWDILYLRNNSIYYYLKTIQHKRTFYSNFAIV